MVKPHVLLCVSGCKQAEVTPRLVHNLMSHPKVGEHEVNVVATPSAITFFDRAQVESLLKKKIFVEHRDTSDEFPVAHIGLAQWAELILVYPASANTLAKCAHGLADTLLTNLLLAARCPIYVGPTMNKLMFDNKVVRRNLKTLKELGFHFIEQELARVKIAATGKVEEKLYCTESMVLQACVDVFGDAKSRAKKKSSARA